MAEAYQRAKELAEKWGVTTRRINQLCAQNYLPGSVKMGKFWMIPENVEEPAVLHSRAPKAGGYATHCLPCPVGITSYKEVVTECYYVDKTLLIRDLLDEHSKVWLFTRPRRFGKTLAMDMLRTFFEKTREDTSVYFSDKMIWKEGEKYRSHQGRYPVIFLSFKDAHQNNWEDMYRSLCFSIRQEYLRHRELMESDQLTEYDQAYIREILNGNAPVTDYEFSLARLSGMLHDCCREKVIVIIDEYDTPIWQGHLYGYYDKVVAFMRNLLSSVFKDNLCLQFGFLTGILRIAKESLFSGLNNLVVDTVMDKKYAGYFGFTQSEVDAMAAYYGQKKKREEIRQWYDGYRFGKQDIYNPWSVICYFNNHCLPKAFWSRTSGNEIIRMLIESADSSVQESLSLLLQGGEVESLINTDIIYPEINGDPDSIYSFLLVCGYLKISDTISFLRDNPICTLKIPNLEIRSVFQKEILDRYSSLYSGYILRNFELALRAGKAEIMTETLQRYLLQSASCFDTAHEDFYHGTLFGMVAILSENYYISSNREAGEGRFDLQLEPRDKMGMGYLIECKVVRGPENKEVERAADETIRQIEDRNYATEMQYHGIRRIGCFGIAFRGKEVCCRYRTIETSEEDLV